MLWYTPSMRTRVPSFGQTFPNVLQQSECRRLTSAAWRRTAEVSSLPCGTLDGSSSCSRCSPTRVTRRRAGCFYACGGRNTSRLQRPSRLLAAAEPSRLPLGHRPCLSGRRQPSSLGASETGNGSSGSTSPRWRRCARGCRRGCAAPGLTSGSLWSSRSQRRRRGRQRPHPLHRRPWLWGPSRQTLRWRPCGSAILPGGLRFASPPS